MPHEQGLGRDAESGTKFCGDTAVLDGDGVLYQIGHGEGADKFVIRRALAADGEATTVYASTDRPEVFANSGELM